MKDGLIREKLKKGLNSMVNEISLLSHTDCIIIMEDVRETGMVS